jgi:hypothetical protein
VSTPTPRTDETLGWLAWTPATLAHARMMEKELVEVRLRLARCQAIYADCAERDERHADEDAFRAAAKHLRDLSTPLDLSKL